MKKKPKLTLSRTTLKHLTVRTNVQAGTSKTLPASVSSCGCSGGTCR
jgi:hypothetical protein